MKARQVGTGGLLSLEGTVFSVKIMARHLTGDLYNCKASKLKDRDGIKAALERVLAEHGCLPLELSAAEVSDDHFAVIALTREGHVAVHVYAALRYVAVDVFLCKEGAEPELMFKSLRGVFLPDKTKTTILKRGDFGTEREIKPKTKTKMAPLRRIHNTGAKVIRILARRNKN